MSSRIRAAGYRGGSTAENVAAGQKDAYSVVESWMWYDMQYCLNCVIHPEF